jgi:signal transduction histidine kinase
MAGRAGRRKVTIDWQPSSNGAAIVEATWDEEAVRQALLNLLDNAVRHGGSGGQVRVTAEQEGDAMKVSVSDDGPGIPRRDRKRIFGRFERSETESVGNGLGLALVERVTQAHGGRVDLVTERNQGSTFTLVLPLLPPAAEAGLVDEGSR